MENSTHAQDDLGHNSLQKNHNPRFSSEEKCYLAHHVNQCHDFDQVRQMFNLKFCTDRTLESMEVFFAKCNEHEFFDLTEQAEAYKWCTPHPLTPILPPSMVLGTAEWRTELRAFLVYQASRKVNVAEMQQNLSDTFPGESRTCEQIGAHLDLIVRTDKTRKLVTQLERFAARYPWHPEYAGGAGGSKATPKADGGAARAAARDRIKRGKQRARDYDNNHVAMAAQLELMGLVFSRSYIPVYPIGWRFGSKNAWGPPDFWTLPADGIMFESSLTILAGNVSTPRVHHHHHHLLKESLNS